MTPKGTDYLSITNDTEKIIVSSCVPLMSTADDNF